MFEEETNLHPTQLITEELPWAVSLQTWTCDQLTRYMPTVDARDRALESEGAEREEADEQMSQIYV